MSEVLKEEKIMFLKSSVNALQGNLQLTSSKLVIEAHKTTVGGGILGAFLKKKVEEKDHGTTLNLKDISEIRRGKHGVNKNVLEVVDQSENVYRLVVKNYDSWQEAIQNAR
ncbi:MAG: hypothetical protein NXI10_12065 [bacterium]|nr:hypothetical protein [bacterium]